jgi:hypothetical protein
VTIFNFFTNKEGYLPVPPKSRSIFFWQKQEIYFFYNTCFCYSILFLFYHKLIFLHIVMKRKIVVKVAPFYTKNRSESSTFCIILFHLLGDDCQSILIFFLLFFINPFRSNFSTYVDMQKNSVL